jgi:predicted small secreted protein
MLQDNYMASELYAVIYDKFVNTTSGMGQIKALIIFAVEGKRMSENIFEITAPNAGSWVYYEKGSKFKKKELRLTYGKGFYNLQNPDEQRNFLAQFWALGE